MWEVQEIKSEFGFQSEHVYGYGYLDTKLNVLAQTRPGILTVIVHLQKHAFESPGAFSLRDQGVADQLELEGRV